MCQEDYGKITIKYSEIENVFIQLYGSLRLETIMSLAKKNSVNLGVDNIDQLKNLIKPGKMHASLKDILIHGVKSAFMPYEYKKSFIIKTKKHVKELIIKQAKKKLKPI